ncbi:radical SAM protein [Sulfobacillus sp. hq2]|uniref:radical SAM protein n=1 Tax=Sulfobacillus TaxID=28033 RepID=UPI000CD1380D|nr:radical SAM protein [Sulfobacillus sp. hq2]POB11346.1 radical SAM protein [Sulfobacillus sp. hq2]
MNWSDRPLEELITRAGMLSQNYFARSLTVSAPSQKHYDTGIYQNHRTAFASMSVTGNHCALQCDHCGTKVLEGMTVANSLKRFRDAADTLVANGTDGVLISGGCLEDGSVPLERFVEDIARLKDRGLTVLVHTGLVKRSVAHALKMAGVDQILLDIIGADETIHRVYHLDKTTRDYRESLAILREEGLNAVPHVVVGLHFGALLGEFNALEMIRDERCQQLVIVALMPLPGTPMAGAARVSAEDVARVIAAARIMMPSTPISLGCARPPGPDKLAMEAYAIDCGVQSIAYPLAGTIRYAEAKGYTIHYNEKCCSLLA